MSEIVEIYITHYKPLVERKIYLDKEIKKNNLNAFFITSYDRGSIEFKKTKFTYNKILWWKQLFRIINILNQNAQNQNSFSKSKFVLTKLIYISKNNLVKVLNLFTFYKPRKLSNSEKSLILKHIEALKKILISGQPGVVCEDDIRFENFSKEILNEAFELCKKEFDFISLGHGSKELPFFSNDIPLKSNYRFIKLSTPRNCTALAYMVSPKTAKILLDGLSSFVMPADWQIQYLLLKNNLRSAWVIPPLFLHGSLNEYDSSLR